MLVALTALLPLSGKKITLAPPQGGDKCCSTLMTALMVDILYDWFSSVVVDDMALLLAEPDSLLFLYAILCGLVINIILVDWVILYH